MGGVVLLVVVVAIVAVVMVSRKRARETALARAEQELEPAKRLALEDVTALGDQLRDLDLETAGQTLDEGARSDYQRALDAYEAAGQAGEAMTRPEDISNVTKIVEDGRYAIACVRARLAGQPLPTRRPACFFDPRHGIAVTEVDWAPSGGAVRQVPACALDAERVTAGADPDVRQVMVGSRRVPYWEGGRAYRPYAQGYFGGFGFLDWMFMGFMFEGIGDGLGALAAGLGEGIGEVGSGIGDLFGGIGDGIGDLFDGFDL
jgi:hypothetical protein